MTTTNEMRRRAKAAIEAKPLPQPPGPPEPPRSPELAEAPEPPRTDPWLLERLDRLAQDQERLHGMLGTLSLRLEHTPASAAACEQAAARAGRAADTLTASVPLMQAAARRMEEAGTEVIEHREGPLRRLAAALILTCSLSSVLGTLWLAWKANLL